MDYSWLTTSWTAILMVLLTTAGIYITLIVYTRIAGLRTFSKMSSFDFVMTVAIGAIIGSTILTPTPPLIQSMVALAMLFFLNMAVAKLRKKSKLVSHMVDNDPLLLMRGTDILNKNLKEERVTHDDLRAKLREANVTQLNQVKAVVMETTGDISVLHHNDPNHKLEEVLLKNVLQ